jgi:hypothetical protein
MEGESVHEVNVFADLECDPNTGGFFEQRCQIKYRLNGELREHYPDLVVIPRAGVRRIKEIKLASNAGSDEVKSRTALMNSGLPAFGYDYDVQIADLSETEPGRRNREIVASFSYRTVPSHEKELMVQECRRSGGIEWGAACRGVYGLFGREILCRLFVDAVLSMNVNEPLTEKTRFIVREGVD